ncbi:MAG: hypothetical protein H0A76_02070 [Candidatus Thiodubiliella endoseptemdiera]|uniref:Uncharacterized protein n=1 Tax=Candidatus Thiodubiliella endoseptemdiera TaxID=2738886 RepID=A0A853EZM8_9GAMM|nr:hypothetical protein [Candidatus Thiodubiliella endoseptemdiera]
MDKLPILTTQASVIFRGNLRFKGLTFSENIIKAGTGSSHQNSSDV